MYFVLMFGIILDLSNQLPTDV